jgi:glycosyltransferase involved in cell wall biosynthesis
LVELGLVEPGKLHVIGNGVDGLTEAAGHSSAAVPVEVPGEYLLTVGSRDPRKNVGRLVAAYRRACSSKPLPPLLVVGGRGRAFAEVETCRSDGVRYLGRVDDEQLSWLYSHAKAVVNVSTYEGFGLTVAEAARAGVPLLLSDIPPHRELVAGDEAVLWVDPFDQSAMTTALLRLDRCSPAAHQVVGHSWVEVGAAYSDLFRFLMGELP